MWNHCKTQLKSLWEEDIYYIRTVTSWISSPCIQAGKQKKHVTAKASIGMFMLVMIASVFFPVIANADMEYEQMLPDSQTVGLIIEQMKNETRPYGHLPESQEALPRRTYSIPMTAYTSEPGQTDDSPCITASGLDVCARDEENVVAANFLPLGTRVRIPELYGNRVFYVEDRMNARYNYKMDIWMKQKSDAKRFGVKHTTVEVF